MNAERLAALLECDCRLVVKDVVTSTNDEVLEQARTRVGDRAPGKRIAFSARSGGSLRPPLGNGVLDVPPRVSLEQACTRGVVGQVGRVEPLPLVVVSSRQTAGRGRLGRTWSSPPGGVYLSVLLGVNELAAMLGEEALYASLASLSPLTALAAWEATHAFATDELRIKWPNDLISARGKLAGILVESRRDVMPGSDTPDASDTSDAPNTPDTPPVSRVVIIGIGVNVNRPGQGASAVSAYLNDRSDGSGESAGTVGTGSSRGQLLLEDVAAAVINELLGHYERWRAAACSFAPFVAGYRAHMALMGEDVCVRDVAGSELARGIVEGIDDRARLILTGPRGSTAVVAGEVTLRDC